MSRRCRLEVGGRKHLLALWRVWDVIARRDHSLETPSSAMGSATGGVSAVLCRPIRRNAVSFLHDGATLRQVDDGHRLSSLINPRWWAVTGGRAIGRTFHLHDFDRLLRSANFFSSVGSMMDRPAILNWKWFYRWNFHFHEPRRDPRSGIASISFVSGCLHGPRSTYSRNSEARFCPSKRGLLAVLVLDDGHRVPRAIPRRRRTYNAVHRLNDVGPV